MGSHRTRIREGREMMQQHEHEQPTFKPAIRRGQRDYVYNVESSTRPGTFHTVDAYHMTCSCEAGRRGRRCHHLADAIVYDQWRKVQRAKAVVETPARPSGMAALQD